MLTFLRRIRKSLIESSEVRKPASPAGRYLLYAIGEITLVVLGILIALQINNWNENNKTREKEVKLLIELKDDLLETKSDLLTDIRNTEQIQATTNTLYKAILENQISDTNPFKLSTTYLRNPRLFPKLSAYEAIQSEGLTIISNDKLRKMITDFYQLHLKRIGNQETYLFEVKYNELKPYIHAFSNFGSTCEDCEDLYDLNRPEQDTLLNLYLLKKVDYQLVHIIKEQFNVQSELNQRRVELSDYIDEIIESIDQDTDLQQ